MSDTLARAIRERTGIETKLSTTGGTSDGRFLATLASEVVEFGPINESIHKIDEHVAVADLGPLSTPDGVKDLDAGVQKSVREGAKLLTGGHPLKRPGNFYAPTVLTNIPKESPAYGEEFFGPVASVFRVKDIDEAIRLANDVRFGLGSSIWTNDEKECERFINEIEAGMVFINKMVASDPRIPFGGVKASGHGRELGKVGIREFVNAKTVWIA